MFSKRGTQDLSEVAELLETQENFLITPEYEGQGKANALMGMLRDMAEGTATHRSMPDMERMADEEEYGKYRESIRRKIEALNRKLPKGERVRTVGRTAEQQEADFLAKEGERQRRAVELLKQREARAEKAMWDAYGRAEAIIDGMAEVIMQSANETHSGVSRADYARFVRRELTKDVEQALLERAMPSRGSPSEDPAFGNFDDDVGGESERQENGRTQGAALDDGTGRGAEDNRAGRGQADAGHPEKSVGEGRESAAAGKSQEFGLTGETEAEAREAAKRRKAGEPELTKEQIDREMPLFSLDGGSQNTRMGGSNAGLFTPDGRATVAADNAGKPIENLEFTRESKPFGEYLAQAHGDYFQAAKDYFRSELQRKFVVTQIGKVHMTGLSWQEIRSEARKDKQKSEIVPYIPNILKTGQYGGREALTKQRSDGFIAFHSFTKDLALGDGSVTATVKVGEREGGTYQFIAYSIGKRQKVETSGDLRGGSLNRTPDVSRQDKPTETVAPANEGVNSQEGNLGRYPVPATAAGAAGFVDIAPKAGERAPTVSPQDSSTTVDNGAAESKVENGPASELPAKASGKPSGFAGEERAIKPGDATPNAAPRSEPTVDNGAAKSKSADNKKSIYGEPTDVEASLANIKEGLNKGRTLSVGVPGRGIIEINRSAWVKWKQSGTDLFKVEDGTLYIAKTNDYSVPATGGGYVAIAKNGMPVVEAERSVVFSGENFYSPIVSTTPEYLEGKRLEAEADAKLSAEWEAEKQKRIEEKQRKKDEARRKDEEFMSAVKDVLKLYGATVNEKGLIAVGKTETGLAVSTKNGRFQVRSAESGNIVYSGYEPESIGRFVEKFMDLKRDAGPAYSVQGKRPGVAKNPSTVQSMRAEAEAVLGRRTVQRLEEQGLLVFHETEDTLPAHVREGAGDASLPSFSQPDLPGEESQSFKVTEKAYGGRAAYEKAKAAGHTKLDYRQWVQVRTPEFKAWFGDWEAARNAAVLKGKPVASVRMEDNPEGGYAEVERWAAQLFKEQGGKATNPEIGDVALDARAAKDSMAHGGANEAKKAAFGAVKDVIEKGAVIHRATEGREDSFYISAPVDISGKQNIVTVLVHRDPNTQRMYLHSVMLKENLQNPRVSAADARASEPHGSTGSGDIRKILQGLLDFNPDTASKVTDPVTGEPLVVYHGTDADVSGDFAFSYKFSGKNGSAHGRGFYLTTDKEYASGYGTVSELFLNIKNAMPTQGTGKLGMAELKKLISAIVDGQVRENVGEIEDYKGSFLSDYVDTYSTSRQAAINEAAKMLYDGNDNAIDVIGELTNVSGSAEITRNAVRDVLGFDGVMSSNNNVEGHTGTVYVAWFPNQIKSATRNSGAFSPWNNNIYYQSGRGDASLPFFSQQGRRTLAGEMARWSGQVDGFRKAGANHVARMGVPAVLRELGIKSGELSLSGRVLSQIAKDHPEVSLSMIKNLPAMLSDPLYVYPYRDSNAAIGEKSGLNAITQTTDKDGKPVLVGVRFMDGKISTVFAVSGGWESIRNRVEKALRELPDEKTYSRNGDPAVADITSGSWSGTVPASDGTNPLETLFRVRRNVITREKLVNKYGGNYYQSGRGAIGGVFDGKVIHLVGSNIERGNAGNILVHEGVHPMLLATKYQDSAGYARLMGQLADIYNGRRSGLSEKERDFFERAKQRIPEPDTLDEDRKLNEFGAYAAEVMGRDPLSLPARIRRWVQSLLDHIKTWLGLNVGVPPKNVTAEGLRRAAVNFLRRMAREGGIPGKAGGKGFSEAESGSEGIGLSGLESGMRRVRGSDAAEAVKGKIVGKPLENLETGIVATVSGDSWGKMMSKSNVERSASSQAHMQALGNIDTLFPLATLENMRGGKKPQDALSLGAVSHFVVPMPFDGDVMQVRIMVKHLSQDGQGNRVYFVTAVEIENAGIQGGDPVVSGQFQRGRDAASPPASGVSDRFAQMVSEVKAGMRGPDVFYSVPQQAGPNPMPAETKAQLTQRKSQDQFNRFNVLNKWLEKQGITLGEKEDVYRAEERMHPKIANQIEDMHKKTVQPLIRELEAAGFTPQDAAQFLHAQHAAERNAQVAKHTPSFCAMRSVVADSRNLH